jgi:hypothetical protein
LIQSRHLQEKQYFVKGKLNLLQTLKSTRRYNSIFMNLFLISSCIVLFRRRSGIFSSTFLGSLGLCHVELWSFFLAGVRGVGILGIGRFGAWSLFVFSGVFGGRETLDVLRGWRGMCWS